MKEYDYLIAGGGGAGLGLACALLDSPDQHCSILIIDRDSKQQNDRTWCFWGSPQTPFVDIARHSWQKIAIRDGEFERIFPLGGADTPGWRYWMVRGIDYYNHARGVLEKHPNVEFRLGSVERFEEEAARVLVTVDGETVAARWVFDSIIRPGDLDFDPGRQHMLKQHFTGWEIETPQPVFDPSTAILFDFTTPQKNDLRFFYVLPFSETRALVEYTIFSPALLEENEYDAALREFIGQRLGIEEYTIDFVEHNWIPMTDYPFARKAGARIMNIGTKGGLVKPSTGYAFKRMQYDARAIVDSLVQYGNPFQNPRSPRRYWFYDRLLLQILYRQGQKMKPIFVQLFARNPIARVFHFLDEDAALHQDLALIASLPPWPFLKALFRVFLLKKI